MASALSICVLLTSTGPFYVVICAKAIFQSRRGRSIDTKDHRHESNIFPSHEFTGKSTGSGNNSYRT
jgi:hypothetical protein